MGHSEGSAALRALRRQDDNGAGRRHAGCRRPSGCGFKAQDVVRICRLSLSERHERPGEQTNDEDGKTSVQHGIPLQ